MTVGEIISIIALILTFISVLVAILVFNHNAKKDREENLEKRTDRAQKEQVFYTETSIVLGELKADMSDIKSQLKEQGKTNTSLEMRVVQLEERVKNVEKALKL